MHEEVVPLGGTNDWRKRLISMPIPNSILRNSTLKQALDSLIHKGRIDRTLGVELYFETDINALFSLAHMVKYARFSDQIFFNQNLHVKIEHHFVLLVFFL